MRDYIALGSRPTGEQAPRFQTTDEARRETGVYLRQLRRIYGQEPLGASLALRTGVHEYGTYYEVVCWYVHNTGDPMLDYRAHEYAAKCDREIPTAWDTIARAELKQGD